MFICCLIGSGEPNSFVPLAAVEHEMQLQRVGFDKTDNQWLLYQESNALTIIIKINAG